jgi:hypothetical protein
LRAGSHAALLEQRELARTDGRIAQNPGDRAFLHHILEVPEMVLVEIHQPEEINGLPEEMQRRRPEAVVAPAVAAIEHHAPSVRSGDRGALAVTDIEDLDTHGAFL